MDEAADKITLRQMQIFLAAVECQSFSRAAHRLGLSPPAVSMQMGRLGDALGVDLFVKEGRAVRPTPAATALVPYASQLAETLREAVHVVGQVQDKLDSEVRVAMVSTARNFGPQLVQHFQKRHPDARVEISIANREGVIARLRDGRADLALMGRPPLRIEVTAHRFATHPYVLIAAPEHPLVRFRHIKRKDLVQHRFLVREEGSGTRMVHEHFFRDVGLDLPQAQEMDSNGNIKQAVIANMGLAFLSAHTIALERQAGKLSVLQVEGMPQLRDWFVVYPRGKQLSSAARNFRDFVETEGSTFLQALFGRDFGAS